MTPSRRWERSLFAALLALGGLLRLYDIGYSFDSDEAFSVSLASGSLGQVLAASLQDAPHPPLHNLLLYIWMQLFGTSEVAVRSLSVACSLGFLFLAYRLFRRFLPVGLALGALLLVALSPLFVQYGQWARPYAVIALLSVANLLAFFRVLDAPDDSKRRTVWMLSGIFLIYSQYIAGLVILLETGFLIVRARTKWRGWLAAGLAGPVLILPWMVAAMGQALAESKDPLPSISWMPAPTPGELAWFFTALFGDPPGVRQVWLLGLLALLVLAYLKAQLPGKRLPAEHVFFLLLGLAIPVFVWVISALGPKPVFAQRQLLGSALALAVLTGFALASLPRLAAMLTLAVLTLWTAAALPSAFPRTFKPPWRDIAAQLDRELGSERIITQEVWVRNPLRWYRQSGEVEHWEDSSPGADRFLFICRPGQCSRIEAAEFRTRSRLRDRWEWAGETSQPGELELYEVRQRMP